MSPITTKTFQSHGLRLYRFPAPKSSGSLSIFSWVDRTRAPGKIFFFFRYNGFYFWHTCGKSIDLLGWHFEKAVKGEAFSKVQMGVLTRTLLRSSLSEFQVATWAYQISPDLIMTFVVSPWGKFITLIWSCQGIFRTELSLFASSFGGERSTRTYNNSCKLCPDSYRFIGTNWREFIFLPFFSFLFFE